MNRAKVRRSRFTSLHEPAQLRLWTNAWYLGKSAGVPAASGVLGSRRAQLLEAIMTLAPCDAGCSATAKPNPRRTTQHNHPLVLQTVSPFALNSPCALLLLAQSKIIP